MLVRDNRNIPEKDKDFFILLRIGLWQKVEEKLSDNPDWEYIYRLATEQTVQGIIADGIGLYQKEYKDINITEEQNEKFLSVLGSIITRNYSVNQLQAKICKLFEENNISYVVLKGQAVAQYYSKPLFRVSGDIDFYFTPDNFERAKDIIARIEISKGIQSPTELHYHTYVNDIEVELHGPEVPGCGKNRKCNA